MTNAEDARVAVERAITEAIRAAVGTSPDAWSYVRFPGLGTVNGIFVSSRFDVLKRHQRHAMIAEAIRSVNPTAKLGVADMYTPAEAQRDGIDRKRYKMSMAGVEPTEEPADEDLPLVPHQGPQALEYAIDEIGDDGAAVHDRLAAIRVRAADGWEHYATERDGGLGRSAFLYFKRRVGQ
jgi:hypothetical protein